MFRVCDERGGGAASEGAGQLQLPSRQAHATCSILLHLTCSTSDICQLSFQFHKVVNFKLVYLLFSCLKLESIPNIAMFVTRVLIPET